MNAQKKMNVLCFGGEDWWYHNRGHIDMQLMRRFAHNGIALYVNSIVMQKLDLGRGRKLIRRVSRKAKSLLKGIRKTEEGFWVYSPLSLPIQHISWAKWLNEALLRFQIKHVERKIGMGIPIVWVACPTACDIALRIRKSKLVYQRTDRFEDYGRVDFEAIKKCDQKLKAAADMTIYANRSLYEQEARQCKKALYLDHGVDFEMFASADSDPENPSDIVSIHKPIAGYFGDINEHKLDTAFIKELISLLPEVSFVFVGEASPEFSCLAKKKNVWMLGQKAYEQIPHYGKCFDVAIIPWRKSGWTQGANPIKLKEYLALGKPVVCTPASTQMHEYHDVVYMANTSEEFAQCIAKALDENSPDRIAVRRKKIEKDTWDCKAQLILDELYGNNGLTQ